MKVSGTGEVFLADHAQEIHLLKLADDKITVNGSQPARLRLRDRLGHQARWRAPPVCSRAACSTSSCRAPAGSRCSPTARRCCSQLDGDAAFADPQAAITWSSGVKTSVKTDVNLKTLIGRGSGETLQIAVRRRRLAAGPALRGPGRRRLHRLRAAAGSATCSAGSACQHPWGDAPCRVPVVGGMPVARACAGRAARGDDATPAWTRDRSRCVEIDTEDGRRVRGVRRLADDPGRRTRHPAPGTTSRLD